MKKIILLICFLLFLTSCNNNENPVKNYDFDLIGLDENQQEKHFSLKDFRGENLILYFGYGLCPDVCPATLDTISGILDELINEQKLKKTDIKLLFISLDVNRDTPKGLEELAKEFYDNSKGLMPSQKELDRLADVYGVKYQIIPLEDSELKYSVAHSSSIYLIDKNGKFLGEISNITRKNIVKNLKAFGILKN